MKKPVIIIGAKGLGRVALEIFKANEIIVYGFLDEDTSLEQVSDVSVLGDPYDEEMIKLIGEDTRAFIAIEEMGIRKEHSEMLAKMKSAPQNAIHPNAQLAETASIGYGNLIDVGAVINAHTEIKNNCIIKQSVSIGHDVKIDNFVQVGIGSNIGSKAHLEEGVFVGSGVTIVSGVKVGENARIGAGSVVINDVPSETTVFGNPAKEV